MRAAPAFLAAIAAGLASPAAAQPAPVPVSPAPPAVVWTVQPTSNEIFATYPDPAFKRGFSGRVVLECALTSGAAQGCKVVDERPRAQGFGEAALSLAGRYRADGSADQATRIVLEWRHPTFDAAREAWLRKEYSAVRDVVATDVEWQRRPSGDDVARYYPDRAMRLEVGGSGQVRCFVELTGALSNCVTIAETPAEMGFGDAAARIARLMRTRDLSRTGEQMAGRSVVVRMNFSLPEPAPPPPPR